MAPTQHTKTHTGWTDVAFENTTGQNVPSISRQPFTSSEESLVAARRIGRSRSLSAPSIVPTSAKPTTPPLPPQLPQQSAEDAGKVLVTGYLPPSNTIAPSNASPEFITFPLADVRPPPTMPSSPDTLVIDDVQFENERRVEREKIQSDLWSAQEDVARLKAECEAAGLDTQVRRQPSESLSFSHSYPVEDEVYALPMIWDNFLRDVPGQPYPKGTSTPGGPDGDLIQGWLDNVSAHPIEVPDTTLTALEGTTAAYDDSVEPLPASHDDLAAHEVLLNEIPAVSWSSRQPLR
ncbi:hypothetical protein LTR57_025234 [Friedmanniomyces endolithicus]|nr:hypothetical protein LTR57_025234 [Friedmanniomyces endolithicus]